MSYPLFGPPCEPTDIAGVAALCVDRFPDSENRPMIMEGVRNTVADAANYSTWLRLHIGGEFVSGESEPSAAHILLHAPMPASREDADLLFRLTGRQDVEQGCHIYPLPEIPEGHTQRAWWLRNWQLHHEAATEQGRLGCAIISNLE